MLQLSRPHGIRSSRSHHTGPKQDWERVVKKGNSGYNDKQVEKAMQLKGEPIRVPSEGARDKADAAEEKAAAIIASENKA